MKTVFKITDSEEGVRTLWFTYRGRLVKVANYDNWKDLDMDEDEWDDLLGRDGRIFLRGFNYRE